MDQVETRGSPPIREHYALWRGVRVAEETLVVADRTYQIRDLRRLREQRGSIQPTLRAALGLIIAEAAVVAATVAGVIYAEGTSPAVYVFGGAHALASTILIGLSWCGGRRRPNSGRSTGVS